MQTYGIRAGIRHVCLERIDAAAIRVAEPERRSDAPGRGR
jgi:hypothetical protein